MTQKKSDLLSLYAGLDITYPAIGVGASIIQAIQSFFNKAENILSFCNPNETRQNKKTAKKSKATF